MPFLRLFQNNLFVIERQTDLINGLEQNGEWTEYQVCHSLKSKSWQERVRYYIENIVLLLSLKNEQLLVFALFLERA